MKLIKVSSLLVSSLLAVAVAQGADETPPAAVDTYSVPGAVPSITPCAVV